LLDECGNLKLSDFGLSTVFKHMGNRRVLTTPCGTPPYLAPEIRHLAYHGDQVDIWSSGIILYVLLAGNTAWAEPSQDDDEFVHFVKEYPNLLKFEPWSRFSSTVLVLEALKKKLLIGILNVDAKIRFTITEIEKDCWFLL
jgi:serine/threonine-protein kinase Chk1